MRQTRRRRGRRAIRPLSKNKLRLQYQEAANWRPLLYINPIDQMLETARTAHRTVIARLAARLNAAGLLALKEIDEFRHRCFFNSEALLAWMGGVYAGEPRR